MVIEHVHASAQMREEELLENRRSGELWVQQDTANNEDMLGIAEDVSTGNSEIEITDLKKYSRPTLLDSRNDGRNLTTVYQPTYAI